MTEVAVKTINGNSGGSDRRAEIWVGRQGAVELVETAGRLQQAGADYVARNIRNPGGGGIEMTGIQVVTAEARDGHQANRHIGDEKGMAHDEFVSNN
jgi:hypothetical protein